MDADKPSKQRNPIPVTVVHAKVLRPDAKDIRRILGRELVDAERDKKTRR